MNDVITCRILKELGRYDNVLKGMSKKLSSQNKINNAFKRWMVVATICLISDRFHDFKRDQMVEKLMEDYRLRHDDNEENVMK